MNYRLLCLIALIFSLSVTGLFISSLQTTQHLINTNQDLLNINAELRKHPVHDAEITAFDRHDGNLLIVVNGQFGHIVKTPCANRRAF